MVSGATITPGGATAAPASTPTRRPPARNPEAHPWIRTNAVRWRAIRCMRIGLSLYYFAALKGRPLSEEFHAAPVPEAVIGGFVRAV
jgi:hypothetical protein